ncbi:hypothetical protein VNO78_03675 [Psophocarpus tetragonolobus]|uniref:Uncharacterized protein n=1 Tax=Psophocarpus tetragonolobus TaxID=3891 RepID=A0AAN9T2M3_PSOTE
MVLFPSSCEFKDLLVLVSNNSQWSLTGKWVKVVKWSFGWEKAGQETGVVIWGVGKRCCWWSMLTNLDDEDAKMGFGSKGVDLEREKKSLEVFNVLGETKLVSFVRFGER